VENSIGEGAYSSPLPENIKRRAELTVNIRGESEITSDILRKRRQYFVKEVKAPLMESLVKIGHIEKVNGFLDKLRVLIYLWRMVGSICKYPAPTKDNTKKKITHVLLDIWDEFFTYETNDSRAPLFRAIRRISATECEHDNYYSQRMTWFLKKLTVKYLNGEWPALESWCPMDNWNDPAIQLEILKAAQEFRYNLTINGRPFSEVET